jgi:hypothetical protein
VLLTLAPGSYTAVVNSADSASGVTVVGVYEIDRPDIPLINISSRGKVLTGDDVMIVGFIVDGEAPRKVAIVATGPSLTAYGILDPLVDPRITLVRPSDQAVIGENDDWSEASNAAELTATGFAPPNAKESAILITLPPGAYTAVVSGVGGTTGTSVVGVYAVP